MPPTRRAKINGAKQTSASHAKGPAVTMTIGRSSPLAWKKSPRRETSLISPFDPPELHMVLHARPRRYSWNPDVVLIILALSVHTKSPDALPRNLSWVHLGFGVTIASRDASRHPRRRSMRPDRIQIEPARVTAGKSFSGSNTLLKKFVREYIATSATISMTFASV